MNSGRPDQGFPGEWPRAAEKCGLCGELIAPGEAFWVNTTDPAATVRCCQQCGGLFAALLDVLRDTGENDASRHGHACRPAIPASL
jgi:hypothetical protein